MKTLIPPPIVTIVFLFVIFFTKDIFRFSIELPTLLGYITIVAGLIIIFVAAKQFKAANTTINPTKPETASVLVSNGVFSYSRNPMYLGMLIIIIGFSIIHNLIAIIVFMPLWIIYMINFQIIPEEEAMKILFKEEFLNYSKKTRRWI
jgi:protein-S-isoprenylcysteine O-methyltransferase Ste14|tara:strand:- start:120 stop:563 length:444 start_codon:yes stop_codon:yes gene_type:complete